MGVQLLDKTRKINKLLHNNSSSKVVFNDICEVLTEILDSNVLVISKKGKVLGGSKCEGVPYITELIEREIGKHVDDMLNERLLSILSTKENVNLQTLGFSEETVKGYQAIITPIDIAGERLGTLFIYKKDKVYEIDDIILSEYGTTVVGLEMLRSVNEESAEETRKEHIVQSAISTLSYSELEAIIHIFDELDGAEGILVAVHKLKAVLEKCICTVWMQCLGTASIPADWQLHLLPPLPSAVPLHIIYLPCATPFHKIRDCLAQSP